ncbi:MAG: carboxymuconolactone decarboxylase family protein [Burkholderiaceae bacterium]
MRLPVTTPPWYLRAWFAASQRRTPLEPTLLWARAPRVFLAFMATFGALRRRASPLPPRLRALVSVRVSQRTGCAFCIDMNAAFFRDAGGDLELLQRIDGWPTDPAFSEAERAALAYAEAVTATPPMVSDDLLARVRRAWSDDATAELTALIAFQNMSARFNAALGAQAYGFCTLPADRRG